MTDIRIDTDEAVKEIVRKAATAACFELDGMFPESDSKVNPGITSNFASLLEAAMMEMLKGRSILNDVRGHATNLPTLVIDEFFFGRPSEGDAYLVVMYDRDPGGLVVDENRLCALCPDFDGMRPLDMVSDAFTSFEAATAHAAEWLQSEGVSIERAREMQLVCKAVGFAENKSGYFVLDPTARRRAA
jgi:hypothetical protein